MAEEVLIGVHQNARDPDGNVSSLALPAAERGEFQFPLVPRSWFYIGSCDQLRNGPVELKFPGQAYVAFRTESGQVGVLDGRCCHANANLAYARVDGECLRCPLHGWGFETSGRCVEIPATNEIPGWAKQRSYPVTNVGGHLYFFNAIAADYAFPFFEGVRPDDLVATGSFDLPVDAPWHVVAANGFDVQHFRGAHDRRLIGEAQVSQLGSSARRIRAKFAVEGTSWRDRMTRTFSGREVTMDVTVYAGSLVLTAACFRRTTTYGLLTTQPLAGNKCVARVVIFVERSQIPLGKSLIDLVNGRVRRNFVRHFLESDVERIAGVSFHPKRLIGADKLLREYLEWLEQTTNRREP